MFGKLHARSFRKSDLRHPNNKLFPSKKEEISIRIHSSIQTYVSMPVVAHDNVTSISKLSSAEISDKGTYYIRFVSMQTIDLQMTF